MAENKKEIKKKRKREGDFAPTIGQLTSHIKNKQVRSEQYAKLKHKAQVFICPSLHPLFWLSCCSCQSLAPTLWRPVHIHAN
jgi:predicted MPP superfamily phosphohydrolase